MKKSDKEMVTNLDYKSTEFLISEKGYHKTDLKK